MVSMFPSSSRVKLNRVTLKDVVGLKLAPRKRRTPKAAVEVSTEAPKHGGPSPTECVTVDANAPSPTVMNRSEKHSDTAKNNPEGRPRENHKARRRSGLQASLADKMERRRSGQSTGDFIQNAHQTSSELAGSEECIRKSVGASLCLVCGECKYISPRRRNAAKKALISSSADSGPSPDVFEVFSEKRAVETSEKIVVWINEYPKVILCDIAARCDLCSHNCGYILPDDLKNKKTHCFKRDLRAGFQIWPSCLGHSKRDDEQGAEAKNSCSSPSVMSLNGNRHADSLTEQHKHIKDRLSEASLSPSKFFYNGWKKVDPAPLGSYLKAVHAEEEEIRSSVVNRDPGSEMVALKIRGHKRKKLGKRVECSSACSSELEENNAVSIPGRSEDPAEANVQRITLDLLSETDDWNVDEPESLTCQRVRPYFRTLPSSCARTYMSWPFLNSAPQRKEAAASSETSAGYASDSITERSNLPGSSTGENHNLLSDATIVTAENLKISTRNFGAAPSSPPSSSLLSGEIQNAEGKAVTQPSLSFALPINCDSCRTLPSPVSLHQDQNNNNERLLIKSPTRLEPFDAKPLLLLSSTIQENYADADCAEFLLPPVLSPVTSPLRCFPGRGSLLNSNNIQVAPVISCETSLNFPEQHSRKMEGVTTTLTAPQNITPFKSLSSPSDSGVGGDGDRKETLAPADSEENCDRSKRSPEDVTLEPEIQPDTVSSNAPTEENRSPSSLSEEHASFSDEEEQGSAAEVGSSSDDMEHDDRQAGGAKERQSAILDEFAAYAQDILLVDVVQEDPELFESLPEKSLLKLGPVRDTAAPKKRPIPTPKLSPKAAKSSSVFEPRSTPDTAGLYDDSTEMAEEKESRPWRPRCNFLATKNPNPSAVKVSQSRHLQGQSNGNNNSKIDGCQESHFSRPIHRVNFSPGIPPLTTKETGPCMKNPANMTDFRWQKSNDYCRLYFSESLSCGFKMCRFQHLPVEGDEKFCVETVAKFAKNPGCLQKAGAVFTGYYQNNAPGMHFSTPVLLTLLWALLKAGMVSNVFAVLRISLAHSIVPGHEFLLALFNYVRDKGLMSVVPELIQVTFKMANVGLELSLDCIDNVKNSPMFMQSAHHSPHAAVVGNRNLSACTHSPEFLNLVHGILEIELCAKQEDWRRMGEVYRSICQFSLHLSQLERISGRIAIALLSESKDKVSLPFAAFAETVRATESESLVRCLVGRIGVSLMLRYHKNHHWTKGRRLVEVMSTLKVNYTTLKSLFGNENGASRCCLITVAAELFLLSGSVEGALNTLREHNWFLSSVSWPCELADLESRTNVLRHLAGKTSHRDTFEVLCNLPGVREPNDMMDISRYSPLFTSHVQACLERQILPVASDTVDFMLCKKLAVDHSLLQSLLEKLGRQNLWLRAREVFKHSLSVGYYPGVSALPGLMALIVPCQLGEVELALTLEMFVAFNASAILPLSDTASSSLSITVKRTQTGEGEYISAGNRLLSAACLPQPKLFVRYMAVNSSQEQVFRLDVPSARRWLRHNQPWANEMWTQRPKCLNPH